MIQTHTNHNFSITYPYYLVSHFQFQDVSANAWLLFAMFIGVIWGRLRKRKI